jgi:hypothetical protein
MSRAGRLEAGCDGEERRSKTGDEVFVRTYCGTVLLKFPLITSLLIPIRI